MIFDKKIQQQQLHAPTHAYASKESCDHRKIEQKNRKTKTERAIVQVIYT